MQKSSKNFNAEGYFFDSHCHLYNLSHPGLMLFFKRFISSHKIISFLFNLNLFIKILLLPFAVVFLFLISLLVILVSVIFAFLNLMIKIYNVFNRDKSIEYLQFKILKNLWKAINGIFFAENDIASQLLLLEKDFVSLDKRYHNSEYITNVYNNKINSIFDSNNRSEILIDIKNIHMQAESDFNKNGNTVNIMENVNIKKIILTPLIMDFGYKINTYNKIHYNASPSKPMFDQIVDLYTGIYRYMQKSPYQLFEVYPFMGITPQNYKYETIESMLDFYFKKYERNYMKFSKKFNKRFRNEYIIKIDKNRKKIDHIESLKDFFFAGIKLYPPLGCDINPESTETPQYNVEKIKKIYEFCSVKKIPITIHYGQGGFEAANNIKELTDPNKIDGIFKANNANKNLFINLAHFGLLLKRKKYTKAVFKSKNTSRKFYWTDKIIEAINKYDHIYTDISYKSYWDNSGLEEIIENEITNTGGKLLDRLLFGSDIPVVLFKSSSYKEYLKNFLKLVKKNTKYKKFFQENPYNFLFNDD